MVWNGETITITKNKATGFSRFANIDGSKELVLTGNTSTDMVGPLDIDGEKKGGMMVQLASTQYDKGEERVIESVTITGNEIKGTNAEEIVSVQNHPGSGQNSQYIIKEYTGDMDFVMNGSMKVLDSLTVPEGVAFTIKNGKALTIDSGATFTVAGAFSGEVVNDGALVIEEGADVSGMDLKGTGTSTTTVDVSDYSQGTYNIKENDTVYFTGNLNKDLTIYSAGYVYLSDLNINSGVKLGLYGIGGYNVDGRVSLYGAVSAPGYKALIVPEGSSFTAYAGASISGVDVTGNTEGTGSIDISLAQKDFEIGQDISSDKNFGQLENVVVIDTLTIGNNATVSVAGGFQINEGVTLTIESGAELIIYSSVATVNIAGNVIVEDGAVFDVAESQSVTVSGTIESEGEVCVFSGVTVKNGGSILINEGEVDEVVDNVNNRYHSNIVVTEGLTIEAGAVLDIRSYMRINNITNKGAVTLDGAILGSDSVISLAAENASVVITSVSGEYTLTVTDSGLKFADKTTVTEANQVVVEPKVNTSVSELTIFEEITTSVEDEKTVYKNNVIISGSINASRVNAQITGNVTVDVEVSGVRVGVENALALGNNVILTVGEGSKLTVSGTVTGATKTTSEDAAKIINKGTINVIGLIQIQDRITIGQGFNDEAVINAAKYDTRGTITVANYTTLKAAVDSGAKTIDVLGTITVTESLTIPADVTVKGTNTSTVNVGSTENTDADKAVVLAFQNGAVANGGKYDVYGTLEFDNKKNDKASVKIADVAVIGDVASKYTNIYTAIAGAQAGDVVSIYANEVTLNASLTVPADVTLDVPSGKILILDKGVTLTVNGILKTAQKIATAEDVSFADKASSKTGKYAAAIIVNGKLMSQVEVAYADYKISGVYFHLIDTTGDYYYVTPVEYAATVAAQAQEGTVRICGTVTAGDVSFTGTSFVTVKVYGYGTLTASAITLDNAEFAFDGTSFTGAVKVGDASVTAAKVKTLVVKVKDGTEDRLLVETVKFIKDDDKFKTAAFEISAGTVSLKAVDDASMGPLTVAQGSTLMTSQDNLAIGDDVIVYINGVVTIDNGQTVSVGKTEIMGTISVAKETDAKDAGVFEAQEMFVGITEKDVSEADKATVGATAVLSGKVALCENGDYAVVLNGSDLDSDAVKGLGKVVTVYSVDGKDWITVYAKGDVSINTIKIPQIDNAVFKNWVNEKGEDIKADNATTFVGSENCSKVTAKIDYSIYDVVLKADAGIENVAIDGNLMDHNASNGEYKLKGLKSGTHTVTYTLKNGYSGNATLAVNGEKQSGLSFTVSGAPAQDDDAYVLQLSGISASGYTPVTPVTPSEDKDDGLSLTDILLIVLVVLIVIMAVIVAMRLMRS